MKKLEWTYLVFLIILAGCSIDDDLEHLRPVSPSVIGFFDYEGADPGVESLLLYLKEAETRTPFIRGFCEEYGIPLWDYNRCI